MCTSSLAIVALCFACAARTTPPATANETEAIERLGCDSVDALLRTTERQAEDPESARLLALQLRLIRDAEIVVPDEEVERAVELSQRTNNLTPDAFWAAVAREGYTPTSYRRELRWNLFKLLLDERLVAGYGNEGEYEDRLAQVLARFAHVETTRSESGGCVEVWPRLQVGEITFEGGFLDTDEPVFAPIRPHNPETVGSLGARPSLMSHLRRSLEDRGHYHSTIQMRFTPELIIVRVTLQSYVVLASLEVDDSECEVGALLGSHAEVLEAFPYRVGDRMHESVANWNMEVNQRLDLSQHECTFEPRTRVDAEGAHIVLRFVRRAERTE
ncbi:MAG: hypothetical protein AAGE52_00670 [Myxococcota bacterium]